MELVVTAMRLEADDVVSFELRDAGDRPLPPWEPGAHIDIIVPSIGARQYSLCGDPADGSRYLIAVLNSPTGRGGSKAIHRTVRIADRVEVGGPHNHFPLLAAHGYCFVAGGIGITPLLPMIERANERGTRWELHYGGSALRSMAFVEILKLRHPASRLHFLPQNERGLLPVADIVERSGDHPIYCCGPEGLISAMEQECARRGRLESLFTERFARRLQDSDFVGGDSGFVAIVAPGGREIEVPPGVSMLHALRAAGVDVPFSCEEGTCGTCEVRVIDGRPQHRDSILSAAQRMSGDRMLPCVSRSLTSRITIKV